MNDVVMLKVMDLIKVRIRFLSEVNSHAYLFEEPELKSNKILVKNQKTL